MDDLIKDCVSRGMLYALIPKAAGTSARRAMFVSEGIWEMLSTEHEDEEMEDRLGILQADLELFAEGQPVDPKYLFLLYPPREAVWEIRSLRPEPSKRPAQTLSVTAPHPGIEVDSSVVVAEQ
jgi:hypothetical protein